MVIAIASRDKTLRYDQAKNPDIEGRSSLSKEQLSEALEQARQQPQGAVAARLDTAPELIVDLIKD